MNQDVIMQCGLKKALLTFRSIARRNFRTLDFEKALAASQEMFIKTISEEAIILGHSRDDAYNYAFCGWDRQKAKFVHMCRQELANIRKEETMNKIRSVHVECIIEPKIREAGFEYRIEYQKYRIKVGIRIDFNKQIEFYIRYRDFNDEKIIGGLPEMITASVKYLQDYGPQLSLKGNACMRDWKQADGI